jgi:hypothetical protein
MKRKSFLKRTAAVGAFGALPIASIGDLAVVAPEVEMQIANAAGEFTTLFRGPLTVGRLRYLLRSPAIATLRILRKWGCVGPGWRSMPELERNVAEFKLGESAWASEQKFLEYVDTFLNRGAVTASRLLRAQAPTP